MEQRRGEYRMDGVDRALSYTVLTDVLRQWLVIFCFAVSAALLAAAVMQWHYQPSYTSQATLYVTKKGLPNNVYDNESSAQVMAEHFEQILNSSILQKKVAEEIHLADFAGSASAEAVEGTNLINLAVTAASPELCFKLMQSILKNYSLVSDYMTGNAILEILKAPKIPLTPDQPFERRNIMIKAFLAAAACWVLIFGGLSWLKDTIRTEEDIEQKLEARRLGTLWHERNRKKRTDIRIDDPLISFRYMESLQKLTQHVQKKMEERKAQTLLVTSVLEKEGSTVALPWHDAAVRLFQKSCSALTFDANFDMIASVVAIHQEELSKADLAGDERFIQQNEKVGFLMKQFTYTIQDSMGIHARPAGLLVKAAAAFKDTTIEISSNGKKADVKRIMAIMSMGVKQGAEVTVTCEGADEDAAAEAMEKFFKENL